MTKILIDTCVWLDLAKNSKSKEVLDLLQEFLDRNEIQILVPETILIEFERNKERIIADAGKSITATFSKIKDLISSHGNEEEKSVITHLDNFNHKIPQLGESAVKSIKQIETILKKSEKLPITDQIKINAVQRAIEKRAPFHLSKNSMGDALIIESFYSYKKENNSQEFSLIFITHNKNDFSVKQGNQKNYHEDFAEIFNSPKCRYYIDLGEALNSVNPDIIQELKFESSWDFEPRVLSELLEVQNELEQKIWYNRHMYRVHLIKNGQIKIVSKKNYKGAYKKNVIREDIWKGALKSAKEVEKKYGKKNLTWDDFEWGMLNGKLSAIRWVMGDEWDNLDT